MYKVFINDIPVLLFSDDRSFDRNMDHLFVHVDLKDDMRLVFDFIMEHGSLWKKVYLYSEEVDRVWSKFQEVFTVQEAAGGVVKNDRGQVLVIERPSYASGWDLPKGKLEGKESPGDGARREVEEECGATGLTLVGELAATFHTYMDDGKPVLKKTHWFAFDTPGFDPEPARSEGIENASWVSVDEAVKRLAYNSLRDILKA